MFLFKIVSAALELDARYDPSFRYARLPIQKPIHVRLRFLYRSTSRLALVSFYVRSPSS